MKLFEDAHFEVSQGWFSGWRIKNKRAGTTLVPDWMMKERIGYVWIRVRKVRKDQSINSNFTEQVMFRSFAHAVVEPTSPDGHTWRKMTPDEITDGLIELANHMLR